MANKTSSKSSNSRRNSTKSTKKTASRPTKSRVAKAESAASESAVGEEKVSIDRRRTDRRDAEASSAAPLPERRKKVNRRRQIDPTTCERDYTDQEVEFMNSLDDYKRKSGRMFPTCSEVLEVLRGLGYVKLSTAELGAMSVGGASATSAKPMPSAWQGTDASEENLDSGATVESQSQLMF